MSNHISDYVSICLIDKTDPSDPHKRVEYYWMRTLLRPLHTLDSTPKKHTEQYISLRALLHQSNQIILLLRVCKSECSIDTLLLHFYFLGLHVTCNVRHRLN